MTDDHGERRWVIERPHPRAVLAALLVAVAMLVIGLFLAALGVKVLDLSGGAARDTSIVVAIAAFVVSDFWGGGLVTMLTRTRPAQVALVWGIARTVILLLVALVATRMLVFVPLQLALAIPAAWAGSRVAHKQLQLRRAIAADRARDDARTSLPTTDDPADRPARERRVAATRER